MNPVEQKDGRDTQHDLSAAPGAIRPGTTTDSIAEACAQQARLTTAVLATVQALMPLKGRVIDEKTVHLMAVLVWLEHPHMTRGDVTALCGPAIVLGKILDEDEILNRARNIAFVAVDSERLAAFAGVVRL